MDIHFINKLRVYMDALSANHYFNGVVLVGYKGEVVFKKGYGQSSLQYKIPNTPRTKFKVGSLTKAFTAMTILKLHQQQKLDINQTIDTVLPDFPNGHFITILHLLTNTSGIPNFTSSPDYWFENMRLPRALEDVVDSFKDLELDFEPGAAMSYSNSGYLVLTAIIEKISGLSYVECLHKEILAELGLANTGVDDGKTIVNSLATGHTVWGDVIHTDYIDMSFPLGAYGMYSTVEDLYTWCQALMKSSIVSPALQEQMFSDYKGYGYGFGWFMDRGVVSKRVRHFGDINGFVNHLVVDLDEELVIIVLSNLNITPVTQISGDLAKIVLGDEVEEVKPFSPLRESLAYEKWTGIYEKGNTKIIVSFEKQLFVVVPKMYGVPYKFRLHPIEVNSRAIICKSEHIHDTYTFRLNEEGFPTRIELTDCYGEKSEYLKIN